MQDMAQLCYMAIIMATVKADYIFQTDSDGQTLPSEFWQFGITGKNYDMVIGHKRQARMDFHVFCNQNIKLVL